MRAVWYSELGGAGEVLRYGEVEAPSPGPGEVLVRLATSGVNPVDVKRRQGGRGAMASATVIPHFDGAGIIEGVGEGVDMARVAQRVWLFEAQWQRDHGTAAELVALPSELAVPLPESVSFAEGAALGIPAMTAHRCVFGDGSVEGATVMVTGGAGAVGHYAVQFAALGGAKVIATTSGGAKADLAAAAGAAHLINYREGAVTERVLEITDGAGVDRVVDVELGGNLASTVPLLKTRGVIATYASQAMPEPTIPFYQLLYKNATVRCELVFLMSEEAKHQALADITEWLEAGRLKHHIAETIPLAEAVRAHQAVEAEAFGKVVLTVE